LQNSALVEVVAVDVVTVIAVGVGPVIVIVFVTVAGTDRYELQKEVAGGPRIFNTPSATLIAPQFTARASSCSGSGTGLAATIAARPSRPLSTIILVETILKIEKW